MNKEALLGVALGAALVLGGAGAAFAGEVTGSGKSLETDDALKGKSECAYSGLEDFNDNPEAVQPGTVQSYGQIVRAGGSPAGPGRAGPGFGCNPSDPQNPE